MIFTGDINNVYSYKKDNFVRFFSSSRIQNSFNLFLTF